MKLICIGDSLTFGYGVRTFQRWTRLCAQETGWEIVNEGIRVYRLPCGFFRPKRTVKA